MIQSPRGSHADNRIVCFARDHNEARPSSVPPLPPVVPLSVPFYFLIARLMFAETLDDEPTKLNRSSMKLLDTEVKRLWPLEFRPIEHRRAASFRALANFANSTRPWPPSSRARIAPTNYNPITSNHTAANLISANYTIRRCFARRNRRTIP